MLIIIMLSAIMLNAIMVSVIMLSVIMLSVIRLTVEAPETKKAYLLNGRWPFIETQPFSFPKLE